MYRKKSPIKDMDLIEAELRQNEVGVLAHCKAGDYIAQTAAPFIYLDKNLYFVFSEEEERYEHVKSGMNVVFTIQHRKDQNGPNFKLIEITSVGVFRLVSDSRILETIAKSFVEKYYYSSKNLPDLDESKLRIYMLDTEEFKASEVLGG